ncbi:hypothetical protein PR048_020999, partial [Dryococelus australis]
MKKDDDIKAAVMKRRVMSTVARFLSGLGYKLSFLASIMTHNSKMRRNFVPFEVTPPKSRARAIVESFPPFRENYIKAICLLKERFTPKDLLIQFYT